MTWESSVMLRNRCSRVSPRPHVAHAPADPLCGFLLVWYGRQGGQRREKLRRFYNRPMPNRTVFFISDGTGSTAETVGNSLLKQFAITPRHVRMPFIDTVDKAHHAVREINHAFDLEGRRPIVFTTLVNEEVLAVMKAGSKGLMLDMFTT